MRAAHQDPQGRRRAPGPSWPHTRLGRPSGLQGQEQPAWNHPCISPDCGPHRPGTVMTDARGTAQSPAAPDTGSMIQDSHHHCCAHPPPPPCDSAYLCQPADREQSKVYPRCVAVYLSMVCGPHLAQHHTECPTFLHIRHSNAPRSNCRPSQQAMRPCRPCGKRCLPPLCAPRHLPATLPLEYTATWPNLGSQQLVCSQSTQRMQILGVDMPHAHQSKACSTAAACFLQWPECVCSGALATNANLLHVRKHLTICKTCLLPHHNCTWQCGPHCTTFKPCC